MSDTKVERLEKDIMSLKHAEYSIVDLARLSKALVKKAEEKNS